MLTFHWNGTNIKIPKIKENQSIKQFMGEELDFQKRLDKFPGLPWAKYKGEKHLPG